MGGKKTSHKKNTMGGRGTLATGKKWSDIMGGGGQCGTTKKNEKYQYLGGEKPIPY